MSDPGSEGARPEAGPGAPGNPATPVDPGAPAGALRAVHTIDPGKLLRIASVTREVLEEARRIRPEAGAVEHLRRVHDQITHELQESLPPELYQELDELTPDLHSGSLEELAVAHAEILGWLQGLFQGTQLALQVQAMRLPTRPGVPDEGAESERESGPRDGDPRYL